MRSPFRETADVFVLEVEFFRLWPDEGALGDFDQAKNLGGGMTMTTIGTVGWMAPELFEGHGYTFPADIYSLGMLLYEMISLQIPFEKESQFTLPDRVAKGLQPRIPDHHINLPGYAQLIQLHRQCIAIRPQDRPPLTSIQRELSEIFEMQRELLPQDV